VPFAGSATAVFCCGSASLCPRSLAHARSSLRSKPDPRRQASSGRGGDFRSNARERPCSIAPQLHSPQAFNQSACISIAFGANFWSRRVPYARARKFVPSRRKGSLSLGITFDCQIYHSPPGDLQRGHFSPQRILNHGRLPFCTLSTHTECALTRCRSKAHTLASRIFGSASASANLVLDVAQQQRFGIGCGGGHRCEAT
jgi:hypothetical protein